VVLASSLFRTQGTIEPSELVSGRIVRVRQHTQAAKRLEIVDWRTNEGVRYRAWKTVDAAQQRSAGRVQRRIGNEKRPLLLFVR